ncbi:MAG: MFS transporter, partial [Chloroflexota bacterium]
GVLRAAYAAFAVLGVAHLLLPTLIRQIQATFGQDDAGMGLGYLLYALFYVIGAALSGAAMARAGIRATLLAGQLLVTLGLAGIAIAPTWTRLGGAWARRGLGAGIFDPAVNALILRLYRGRSAAPLSRLHLATALGALAGPVVIGGAVAAGLDWRVACAGVAVVALGTVGLLARRPLPGRMPPDAPSGAGGSRRRIPAVPRPLLVLALAIAAAVAAESGVSNWLVRYLEPAPLATATFALSLFWLGMAAARGLASVAAPRFGSVRYAVTAGVACGVATIAAVMVPVLPLEIALFTLAGFGIGPVYPLIVSIAGDLLPGRAELVGSVLATAAIAGGLVYPPAIGLLSASVGLGVGIAGAGAAALLAAALILLAVRVGRAGRAAGG